MEAVCSCFHVRDWASEPAMCTDPLVICQACPHSPTSTVLLSWCTVGGRGLLGGFPAIWPPVCGNAGCLLWLGPCGPLSETVRYHGLSCRQHADDAQLCISFSAGADHTTADTSESLDVSPWMKRRWLRLKPGKTKVMVVRRGNGLKSLPGHCLHPLAN